MTILASHDLVQSGAWGAISPLGNFTSGRAAASASTPVERLRDRIFRKALSQGDYEAADLAIDRRLNEDDLIALADDVSDDGEYFNPRAGGGVGAWESLDATAGEILHALLCDEKLSRCF